MLEVWDKHGFLYVKILDNETGRVYTLDQRIGAKYYVWTLISYDYLDSRFGCKNNGIETKVKFDF